MLDVSSRGVNLTNVSIGVLSASKPLSFLWFILRRRISGSRLTILDFLFHELIWYHVCGLLLENETIDYIVT